MAPAGARLCQHAIQHARRHHAGKCRPVARCVDVFRRHAVWPRRRTARCRRHDVSGHAISQRCLCARSVEARLTDQVELRARPDTDGDRQGVLRRRDTWLGLCQWQADLQHSRRAHSRRGRKHRQRSVAHQNVQRRHRRHDDDAGDGRWQQADRRQQRRRNGRARLGRGARCRYRQGTLARLQHGTGRSGENRCRCGARTSV